MNRMRTALRALTLGAGVIVAALPLAARPADVDAGRRKAEVCSACHGPDGNSPNPTVPSLAAQPALYTYYQLVQFRQGRRRDAQMAPFAANLTDDDMQDIAAYFAAQTAAPPREAPDPAKAAQGERLVGQHYCNSCHMPTLIGQKHIPRLAGQHEAYLLKELRGFKSQTRADLDGSMTMSAQPLTDGDIQILAHYLARLAPAAAAPGGQR